LTALSSSDKSLGSDVFSDEPTAVAIACDEDCKKPLGPRQLLGKLFFMELLFFLILSMTMSLIVIRRTRPWSSSTDPSGPKMAVHVSGRTIEAMGLTAW